RYEAPRTHALHRRCLTSTPATRGESQLRDRQRPRRNLHPLMGENLELPRSGTLGVFVGFFNQPNHSLDIP
ncbi:MAG: hypothetical protein ACREOG_04590, partial [Gemmatimonadaceae bacterium]